MINAYGLEGGESAIPALDSLFSQSEHFHSFLCYGYGGEETADDVVRGCVIRKMSVSVSLFGQLTIDANRIFLAKAFRR